MISRAEIAVIRADCAVIRRDLARVFVHVTGGYSDPDPALRALANALDHLEVVERISEDDPNRDPGQFVARQRCAENGSTS